jgi:hypothetical protein
LKRSQFTEIAEQYLVSNVGQKFVIYGDPAYGVQEHIISPFKGAKLTADQQKFNQEMSMCRISVEWCFGKVTDTFAFCDFSKNQKLFLQPVGKIYTVSVFLTNLHTCYYGGVCSSFFDCPPPTAKAYMNSILND